MTPRMTESSRLLESEGSPEIWVISIVLLKQKVLISNLINNLGVVY